MTCTNEKIQDLLVLYLENELTKKDKIMVETHLSGCAECRVTLEDFRSTTALLASLEHKTVAADVYAKLGDQLDGAVRAINEEHSGNMIHNIFADYRTYVFAFAAACLIVVTIITFNRNNDKQLASTSCDNSICSTNVVETPKPENSDYKTVITKKADDTTTVLNEIKQVASNTSTPSKVKQSPVQTVVQTQTKQEYIELAKNTVGTQPSVVFRGGVVKLMKKRIVKQWQDVYSGVKEQKSGIINDYKDWDVLWKTHVSGTSLPAAVPNIDFKTSTVVAVFMGEKPTSGYGIRISSIEESDKKIYLELEQTLPEAGAAVKPGAIQPYHIVVIGK
ncbi:MAG: protease complex subunit PrcB family protein [Elusimicrobiota bacterium]